MVKSFVSPFFSKMKVASVSDVFQISTISWVLMINTVGGEFWCVCLWGVCVYQHRDQSSFCLEDNKIVSPQKKSYLLVF
jgi:hypothetical protein